MSAAGTRYAARIDEDGEIVPGPLLGEPQPAEAPRAAQTPPIPLAPPASLDDWLREPAPGSQRR